jgi:ArsR family transcriptional regulator
MNIREYMNCCNKTDISSLIKNIPSENEVELIAEIFKAISDPLRVKILYLLKNKELCVCYINEGLDKPQSTISHHLAILKRANLVNLRKDGKWTYYSLKNPEIIKYIEKIIKKR